MGRLPDLVTEEIAAAYDENYEALEKSLFNALGNLVRVAEAKEIEEKGKEK
ncbi:hypothetical protein [Tissierella sp.]|uniref:hypothetical protein n=1 Tax=Tissierella sp. TaxID=41274 RepID=UPI002867439B|nr:hypothetical protein [Tissierella sp.]MDR7856340.1 hypothetical protein [Tissierella sp.]